MRFFPRLATTSTPTILALVTVSAVAIVALQARSTEAFVSSSLSTKHQHPLSNTPPSCNNEETTMRFPKMMRRKIGKKSKANDEDVETKTTAATTDFEPGTWNPLRLMVMKLGFTELRYTSPLNYEKREGSYNCAYCGLKLFDSSGKYDSGSGWPSFWRSAEDGGVAYKMEFDGRLECRCANAKCSAHLGHVFLDGPRPATLPKRLVGTAPASDPRGRNPDGPLPRFCVNGASLKFEEKNKGVGDNNNDEFFPFEK